MCPFLDYGRLPSCPQQQQVTQVIASLNLDPRGLEQSKVYIWKELDNGWGGLDKPNNCNGPISAIVDTWDTPCKLIVMIYYYKIWCLDMDISIDTDTGTRDATLHFYLGQDTDMAVLIFPLKHVWINELVIVYIPFKYF